MAKETPPPKKDQPEAPPPKPKAPEKPKPKAPKRVGTRERAAEFAKAADPKGQLMVVLANYPYGADPRVLVANAGMTGDYADAMSQLNALVAAGYARKQGKFFQPTPAGVLASTGQDKPPPKEKPAEKSATTKDDKPAK